MAFDGKDNLSVLSMVSCYSCNIEGNNFLSLYFSKNDDKNWKINLSKYIVILNQYASVLT